MEYVDKLYQIILHLIKAIKELVASVKGEAIVTEPTIVDETN